jgi:hypothetical protein
MKLLYTALTLALLAASSCKIATAATSAAAGSPLLCAAMLSFNRPHYLVPSVRAFVSYMTAVEPDIPWTLHILDNGSGPEAMGNITAELAPLRHLDRIRLVHLEQGISLSRAFNVLFFDMCASTGAPYILSLEDDWQARGNWSATVPIMRASMQLLQRNKRLLEVWLRDCHIGFRMHLNASWQQEQFTLAGHPDPRVNSISANTNRHAPYGPQEDKQQEVTLFTLMLTCDPASSPWGGYTNGASLKQLDRLEKLGRMPHINGEEDWSAKACWDGWHVAYICQDPSCYEPEKQWHTGLFEHIGLARVAPSTDARYRQAPAVASASNSKYETLQDVPHHEVMSIRVRRHGYSIFVGLAGESWHSSNASRTARTVGLLLLGASVFAVMCIGVYYGRRRSIAAVSSTLEGCLRLSD